MARLGVVAFKAASYLHFEWLPLVSRSGCCSAKRWSVWATDVRGRRVGRASGLERFCSQSADWTPTASHVLQGSRRWERRGGPASSRTAKRRDESVPVLTLDVLPFCPFVSRTRKPLSMSSRTVLLLCEIDFLQPVQIWFRQGHFIARATAFPLPLFSGP